MNSAKTTLIGLLATCAILYAYFMFKPSPQGPSPAASRAIILNLYHNIGAIENDLHVHLDQLMSSNSMIPWEEGLSFERKLDVIFAMRGIDSPANKASSKTPCFPDAWGTPLHFEIVTNSTYQQEASVRSRLRIWSSGPNGSNEFGNGDDVVLPLPDANE
jgi:hypothetical protein